MNCELCQTEMHTWRNNSDAGTGEPLFRHLASCVGCAERYRHMTELDEELRRQFASISEPNYLQRRIFAGLEHERRQQRSMMFNWRTWMLIPLVASAVFAFALAWIPYMQQRQFHKELAVLLTQPPASQLVTTDRQQLLAWSATVLHGSSQLPPELSRVQFRSGAAVEVAHHRAVMLRMKNEPRASLLVMDGSIRRRPGFTTIAAATGNASLWSDDHRTYVLLFQGDQEAMQAYMVRMGIVT